VRRPVANSKPLSIGSSRQALRPSPFANEFGRIQRRLAHKHGVVLIPKRAFAGLLAADNATVDSVHLSRHGQELMGTLVWELIQGAYQ
jgi:acyl-CoA thioesterase-1